MFWLKHIAGKKLDFLLSANILPFMLNYIRKYTGNWGLKVLYVIVALTFLGGFGGIFGMLRSCGTGLSEGTVAIVNRDAISVDEFSRAYRNILNAINRENKNEVTQEMLNKMDLPDEVLNQLVQNEVVTQEAHKMGFIVTKQELVDEITHMPAFLNKNHQFDPRLFYAVLRENNITVNDFQKDVSRDILIFKLKRLFYDNVFLNPGEVNILGAIQNQTQQTSNENNIELLRYRIAQNAYNNWINDIKKRMKIEKNSTLLARFTQTTSY